LSSGEGIVCLTALQILRHLRGADIDLQRLEKSLRGTMRNRRLT
jgi:hypothetical protein